MNITQVFWTDTIHKNEKDKLMTDLLCWSLNNLTLQRYDYNITLITDNLGSHILADLLKLKYENIRLDFENFKLDEIYNKIWVLKKIFAYSLNNEPFLNIDADVFFWKDCLNSFNDYPLMAQHKEVNFFYYKDCLNKAKKDLKYIPKYALNGAKNKYSASNVGVIGGGNTDFFKKFWLEVQIFLDRNSKFIKNKDLSYLNVLIEQYFLTAYAQEQDLEIKYLLNDKNITDAPQSFGQFQQLPNTCDFMHLMGDKNQGITKEQLAQRLYIESSELYHRVLDVVKQLTNRKEISSIINVSTFERTNKIIRRLLPSWKNFSYDLILAKQELDGLLCKIKNPNQKLIIEDAFIYESSIEKYRTQLLNDHTFEKDWKVYSINVNSFLSLPENVYLQRRIKQSNRCFRIDSSWDWSEKNEFYGQNQPRDLVDNLKCQPAYYEVVLYRYLHQDIIREHRLDVINILVLDELEEPQLIATLVESVGRQLHSLQPQLNVIQLEKTILDRVRHFLYMGIIEIADDVF